MKLKVSLCVTVALFCCFHLATQAQEQVQAQAQAQKQKQAQRDNPFIAMADKPFAVYHHELTQLAYSYIESRDADEAAVIAEQFRQVAKVSKNKKWLLEADFFTIEHHYFRALHLQNHHAEQLNDMLQTYIEDLQQIIRRARKTKSIDIQLRAMFSIWKCRYTTERNYEMGFQYSMELDHALSRVTAAEFPPKLHYYCEMGKQYFSFDEYETAKLFFEKVMEDNYIDHKICVLQPAWNHLGLIYRYFYNDLDKSDSCFHQILNIKLQTPDESSPTASMQARFTLQDEYELWYAIAKGNLGHNHFLREDYDNAVLLLQYAVKKVVENNPFNYPYAAGKATVLSAIFTQKQLFEQAKSYSDTTCIFLNKSGEYNNDVKVHDIEYWIQYYETKSLYYSTINHFEQALAYVDSANQMSNLLKEEYNLKKLHRAEQRVGMQKLNAEMLRSKTYQWGMIAISFIAALILVFLLLFFHLYRTKRAAYHALAAKTRQWAGVDAQDISPDEIDKQLFEQLNLLMTEKRIYKNPDVNLENIAKRMDVNRNYLSNAVNRCTGSNFSAYINEFRIKEAIRILTEKPETRLSLEGIALEVGFSDRTTFYRVFKKVTGLSPSEYKNNIL